MGTRGEGLLGKGLKGMETWGFVGMRDDEELWDTILGMRGRRGRWCRLQYGDSECDWRSLDFSLLLAEDFFCHPPGEGSFMLSRSTGNLTAINSQFSPRIFFDFCTILEPKCHFLLLQVHWVVQVQHVLEDI